MAKAAFNKKRTLFTSTLDLELRKKLVKCYVWTIALYGAETWTLRAIYIYIYIYIHTHTHTHTHTLVA